MLLMIDETRTPALWAPRDHCLALPSLPDGDVKSDCIRIALVNNMPDAALEDTEFQFFELLNAAAGDIPEPLFGMAPVTSRCPSGLTARHRMPVLHSSLRISRPLTAFQILAVLSILPVMTRCPSGVIVTQWTAPVCPLSVKSSQPLRASQTFAVPSSLV